MSSEATKVLIDEDSMSIKTISGMFNQAILLHGLAWLSLGVVNILAIGIAPLAASDISQLVIFGDSLSDTGNLGSVIGGIPAPYFNNRISNGPVAVETLSAKFNDTANASLHLLGLNAGHNYAVAGAKAGCV